MERYNEYKDSGVQWLGEIPSHWKIEPFGRHFKFRKGLPITKADLKENGIAVISYGQIHAKNNLGTTLTESLVRYVSQDYLHTHPRCLLTTASPRLLPTVRQALPSDALSVVPASMWWLVR